MHEPKEKIVTNAGTNFTIKCAMVVHHVYEKNVNFKI